jgi:hypothetical protein
MGKPDSTAKQERNAAPDSGKDDETKAQGPRLTHDPVLELSVAMSKLVSYKRVDDEDFRRVRLSLNEVLDRVPKPRQWQLIAVLGLVVLKRVFDLAKEDPDGKQQT